MFPIAFVFRTVLKEVLENILQSWARQMAKTAAKGLAGTRQLTVEVRGLKETAGKLQTLQRGIDRDIAKIINDIAKQAQRRMVSHTYEAFTVRGPWPRPGTRYGYNLTPARPGHPVATVFTRAPWAVEQELALSRSSRTGGRLLVPLEPVRAGRIDPKRIPARLKPKAMGEKLFPIQTKRGVVLAQRMKRAGLRILWALESKVAWPKRLNVRAAGIAEANRAAAQIGERVIADAIRKAGL